MLYTVCQEGRADLTHGLLSTGTRPVIGSDAPPAGSRHCADRRSLTSARGRIGVTTPFSFSIAKGASPLSRRKAPLSLCLMQAGKPGPASAPCSPSAYARDLVLKAQHGAAGRHLPQQNVAAWRQCTLHVLMVVQMVGVTLVTTATWGLTRMLINWKLDSSTTATALGGHICQRWGSSAAPMLPPRNTLRPAASNILEISVVVGLLSEPVTATISQGQSSKKSSTSW